MDRDVKKRIFLLENDKQYSKAFCQAASLRDITVDADDLVEKDEEELADKIAALHYPLALIDRRARDDRDINDDSGLTFAKRLHKRGFGTFSVVVTAYSDPLLLSMFRHEEIGGVVRKDEVSVRVLLLCIEHFFRYGVFPNGIARFVRLGDPPEGVLDEGTSRRGQAHAWLGDPPEGEGDGLLR
jgi:DNA-binding NarL/FixJ family response regulator